MKPFWRTRAVMMLVVLALAACSRVSADFCAVSGGADHALESSLPVFENRMETEHFVLQWTNSSSDPGDNISEPGIVEETAGYLETAWAKYVDLFGRAPYRAPGKDKIEVVFKDMDCYGLADPPDGPILLNAGAWMKNRGIRQPTSAHELFHKLQYAYGYKTKWSPTYPFMWFTEGTAAWAEVFVWGRVSRSCKVNAIFRDCRLDLYDADDMAMPFWIYLVSGNGENPQNQLMAKFFERCEKLQDERRALNEIIVETYGPVGPFFAVFAKERKQGFWADCSSVPYKCILGPDGNDLVKRMRKSPWKENCGG